MTYPEAEEFTESFDGLKINTQAEVAALLREKGRRAFSLVSLPEHFYSAYDPKSEEPFIPSRVIRFPSGFIGLEDGKLCALAELMGDSSAPTFFSLIRFFDYRLECRWSIENARRWESAREAHSLIIESRIKKKKFANLCFDTEGCGGMSLVEVAANGAPPDVSCLIEFVAEYFSFGCAERDVTSAMKKACFQEHETSPLIIVDPRPSESMIFSSVGTTPH